MMTIPALNICFLLFIISFPCAIDAHAPNKPAVIDSSDNEVVAGANYIFMVTPFDGISIEKGTSCPPHVVRSSPDSALPPLIILPENNSEDNIVRVDTYLNFLFVPANDNKCNASTIWTVDFDKQMKQSLVTTGGEEKSIYSRFQVKKFGDEKYAYQLFRCLFWFDCERVGYVIRNNIFYLALNGDPMPVAFGKQPSVSKI